MNVFVFRNLSVKEAYSKAVENMQAALETESFEKIESERKIERKPAKFARAMDSETERRLLKLEEDAGNQSKKMDRVVEMLVALTKPDQSKQAECLGRQSPKLGRKKTVALKCFKCDKNVYKYIASAPLFLKHCGIRTFKKN